MFFRIVPDDIYEMHDEDAGKNRCENDQSFRFSGKRNDIDSIFDAPPDHTVEDINAKGYFSEIICQTVCFDMPAALGK